MYATWTLLQQLFFIMSSNSSNVWRGIHHVINHYNKLIYFWPTKHAVTCLLRLLFCETRRKTVGKSLSTLCTPHLFNGLLLITILSIY